MNAKRISPKPIFDSLKSIGDPFKQKSFSTRSFITGSKPPKSTKITNDAVALEAGRKKGSIKKSKLVFAE